MSPLIFLYLRLLQYSKYFGNYRNQSIKKPERYRTFQVKFLSMFVESYCNSLRLSVYRVSNRGVSSCAVSNEAVASEAVNYYAVRISSSVSSSGFVTTRSERNCSESYEHEN